jgi:hypothetical protein
MSGVEQRIIHLEQLLRRLMAQLAADETIIAALQQAVRTGQQGNPFGQSGGGSGCYSMAGIAIPAGGNVTGQTVNSLVGGTATAISTNATVYNQMGMATIAGNLIMLGQNPDGTFSVLTQSC